MHKNNALLVIPQNLKSSMNHGNLHLAHYLAKRIDRVDVVSTSKMYDGSQGAPSWKKLLWGSRDMLRKGVEVIHENNIVHYIVRFPRRPSALDYLLRDFWTYAQLRKLLKNHYDICILGGPQLAFVALRLKSLGKVDVLLYEDWDYQPAVFPQDLIWRYSMRYREDLCLRGADGIASVGSCLQDLRKRQGARHVALIPNGVDYHLFARAQEKRPHPPTLLYMGSLSEQWGADLPIRSLPIIRRQIPEARYILIGEGPGEDQLRALATELGLDDCVYFLGRKNYQELPHFLAEADIGVATFRDTKFRRYACPLKIVEYMAAGLPVIGSQIGETQIMIEKARAGETIEFSPEAFASCVLDLLNNHTKYDAYAANAVSFAREHDWEKMFGQLLEFVEELSQNVDQVSK